MIDDFVLYLNMSQLTSNNQN